MQICADEESTKRNVFIFIRLKLEHVKKKCFCNTLQKTKKLRKSGLCKVEIPNFRSDIKKNVNIKVKDKRQLSTLNGG